MKYSLKLVFAVLFAAVLSACNTPDKEIYTRGMLIETVPSGMEIVVDGLKLGRSPLTVEVETTDGGCFVRKTVVTAIPNVSGLNTQVKTFPAYRPDNDADSEVPEKAIFDMSKNPNAPDAVVIEK